MNRVTSILLTVLIVGIAIILIVTPFGLGHPSSGSMEPVLTTSDTYPIVPAGTIKEGDVIVFEHPNEGVLVVHRVIDITDKGYITKGDANVETDQSTGSPPIRDAHVKGKVPSVFGELVVFKGTYWFVSLFAGRWAIVGVIGALFLLVPGALGLVEENRYKRDTDNRPLTTTQIGITVTVAILLSSALFIYLTPVVSSAPVVATTAPEANQNQVNIPLNEQQHRELKFEADYRPGLITALPKVSGAEYEGIQYHDDAVTVSATIGPYSTIGQKPISVAFYRYPSTLPYDWLVAMHSIHPLLAAIASSFMIIAPLGLLYYAVLPKDVPLRFKALSRRFS